MPWIRIKRYDVLVIVPHALRAIIRRSIRRARVRKKKIILQIPKAMRWNFRIKIDRGIITPGNSIVILKIQSLGVSITGNERNSGKRNGSHYKKYQKFT
jgi:hypothetical protein